MKAFTLLAACLLFTNIGFADDWIVGGKTYHNVTVTSVTDEQVGVIYDGGIGHFNIADLSDDLQKKFHYDPIKAKALEDKREADQEAAEKKAESNPLFSWINQVNQEAQSASTPLEIGQVQVQQGKLKVLDLMLSKGTFSDASDATVKNWIDAVMQNKICVGMPRDLVLLAWASPDSDTTSTNGDGDDWETMNYGNFSSIVFLSGGIVKNITQTETSNSQEIEPRPVDSLQAVGGG